MRAAFAMAQGLVFLNGAVIRSAEPGDARPFCDVNRCADPTSCPCTDNSFEIEVEGKGPVLELGEGWAPGMQITLTVFLETRSPGIQGWSCGVRHDPEVLSLERVDEEKYCHPGCPDLFLQDPRIEDCGADPTCRVRTEGFGFILAQVVSLTGNRELPLGRNALARATYRLVSNPGPAGTAIELTDRLARPGAPPVAFNITMNGRSRLPEILRDGWVIGPKDVFHRGDSDRNGRVTIADALTILLHLNLGGPAPACLEAADWDDSGVVSTADAALLLAWLFSRGAPPAEPGPPGGPCGSDPDGSRVDLGCRAQGACT